MLPKNSHANITPYTIIAPLIVLATLCIAWFMLYAQDTEITYLPDPVDGVSDASAVNFDEEVGRISREMEFYPDRLYTPADFLSGDVDQAQNRDDIENANAIPYGTYRTVVKLAPNSYYSVCGYGMDYGTKVFVNSQEVANIGVVSSDPNIAVPCVNYLNFPVYTDENGMVELVMQFSNYAHKEGGSIPFLYISTSENINRYIIDTGLPTYIMSGGLILLAAYYFLDGILRKKRVGLQLAFCCLLFALRDQWFYIVSLIPYDYNWYIHYRVVVAVIALTPMAILTLIESIFPKITHRYITPIFAAITLIGTAIMFIVPTTEVVAVSTMVQYFAIPYLFYMLVCIVRHYIKRRYFGLTDIYVLIGIAILITANLLDTAFNDFTPSVTRGGITPIGMLLFVIIFMSVLATRANEDEIALEKSRTEKEMLHQINNMKTEFLHKMAHEIKTPLTVMSGYAQLTDNQITYDEVTPDTTANLKVISSEAKRLADLVSNLMEMPTTPLTRAVLSKISVSEYLRYITIVCRGLLEKNGNALVIKGHPELSIWGNMEMLVQMMINLAVNSNKHMQNGEFSVEVLEEKDSDTVTVLVADMGCGIPKENRDRIFDKGFTTNGTKGLGLAICKEIAHLHKGDITLEDNKGCGAVFKITLPAYKE